MPPTSRANHGVGMGFPDRTKMAFDHGGIAASITAEKIFRWNDDLLPVDTTVRNSAATASNVTSLTSRGPCSPRYDKN